jgi:hypothetical protein
MTDEAGWLRAAFDGLESAESSSLAHLLNEPAPRERTSHPLRSVATTAGTFGLVLAASLLLGRPRD